MCLNDLGRNECERTKQQQEYPQTVPHHRLPSKPQNKDKIPGKKKCNVLTGECVDADSTDSNADTAHDSSPTTVPTKTQPSPEAQIAQSVNELSVALAKLSKAAEAANKTAVAAKAKRDKESETLKKNLETIKALQKALVDPKKPNATANPTPVTSGTPSEAADSATSSDGQ